MYTGTDREGRNGRREEGEGRGLHLPTFEISRAMERHNACRCIWGTYQFLPIRPCDGLTRTMRPSDGVCSEKKKATGKVPAGGPAAITPCRVMRVSTKSLLLSRARLACANMSTRAQKS